MAILTVRGLDPLVQAKLRERAARHGRSMEAEARAVLSAAVLADEERPTLAASIRRHFADDPIDLVLPVRTDQQRPVDFDA